MKQVWDWCKCETCWAGSQCCQCLFILTQFTIVTHITGCDQVMFRVWALNQRISALLFMNSGQWLYLVSLKVLAHFSHLHLSPSPWRTRGETKGGNEEDVFRGMTHLLLWGVTWRETVWAHGSSWLAVSDVRLKEFVSIRLSSQLPKGRDSYQTNSNSSVPCRRVDFLYF